MLQENETKEAQTNEGTGQGSSKVVQITEMRNFTLENVEPLIVSEHISEADKGRISTSSVAGLVQGIPRWSIAPSVLQDRQSIITKETHSETETKSEELKVEIKSIRDNVANKKVIEIQPNFCGVCKILQVNIGLIVAVESKTL